MIITPLRAAVLGALWLGMLPLHGLPQAGPSPDGALPELAPGQSFRRELGDVQSHWYTVKLSAGDFFRAAVDQNGLDLRVRMIDPLSRTVVKIDTPARIRDSRLVLVIANLSGIYRLKVQRRGAGTPTGQYVIRVEKLRPATHADYQRVTAYRDLLRGEEISFPGSHAAFKASLEYYKLALREFPADDQEGLAVTQAAMGDICFAVGRMKEAVEYNRDAVPLLEQLGDSGAAAYALYRSGMASIQLGDRRTALKQMNDARQRMVAAGDKAGEARSLVGLADAYLATEKNTALDTLRQAESLLDGIDLETEADLLSQIGGIHERWGDLSTAIDYFTRALLRFQVTGNLHQEAQAQIGLGELYIYLGEPQRADAFLQRGLKLAHDLHDPSLWIEALVQEGQFYELLESKKPAVENLQNAIALAKSTEDTLAEATALIALSDVVQGTDRKAALRCLTRAKKLREDLGDVDGVADALGHMAMLDMHQDNHASALALLQESLLLREKAQDDGGRAETLTEMAEVRMSQGSYPEALHDFQESLRLVPFGSVAENLAGSASALMALKNLPEARSNVERALNVIESARGHAPGPKLQISYFASVHEYYELYIEILMRMHQENPTKDYATQALQASEKARARSLLDALVKGGQMVAPADSPASRAAAGLQAEIALVQAAMHKAQSRDELAPLRKELDRLVIEKLKAERTGSDETAAELVQSASFSLNELWSLLGNDTILLEYSLGDEHSYLWALSEGSMFTFELPGRSRIEKAARQLRNSLHWDAEQGMTKQQWKIQRALYASRNAGVVSNLVLAPALPLLGSKRVAIVADGALQFVPFAVLPVTAGTKMQPLIVSNEIVMLPSASVLPSLREKSSAHKPAKTLAVFSDPIITRDDPRLAGKGLSKNLRIENDKYDAKDPCEKKIAEEIATEGRVAITQRAGLFRELVGDSREFTEYAGGAARLKVVTSPELRQYRIVHFATHGIFSAACPETSRLLLSNFDDDGRPMDGSLTLDRIYRLKLAAELVVLSACDTAMGDDFRGEGLVGVGRGFMQAGVPKVIASLWSISPDAANDFMEDFYKEMLVRKRAPAAALRATQLKFLRREMGKKRSSPDYWAAFAFQGEWQ
jgi:tetratricopeptide (TPR) repeat protein